MHIVKLENDSELSALESALEDAITDKRNAADTFRADATLPEDVRERLARSCDDRGDVLNGILARVQSA